MQRNLSRRLASSLALAVAMACGAVHADILKVAPKDSLAVLKINHLSATNKKAADLMAKLGVAAMVPAAADPMAALKGHLGIKAGVDENGDAGLVILGPDAWSKDPAEQQKPENAPAVVLVPVSDYKAFLTSFPDVKAEGEISSFAKDGKTIYVADWGGYAAMSPNKAVVGKKGDGVTPGASAAKELDSKDIVLWANVPALKLALAPQIAAHKEELLAKVEEGVKGNPEAAKFAPVIKALVSQILAAGETFLGDSAGATASLNLSDVGINLAVESEFTPGSYLGKWTATAKSDLAGGSYTAGLPAGPYIFYGGSAIDGKAMAGLMSDFMGPVLKELGTADADSAAKATKLIESAKALFSSTKQMNFGMLAPRGAPMTESLVQLDYVIKGDSKVFAAGMKDYTTGISELMSGTGAELMPFTLDFKPAAKTVDGVPIDLLSMTMKDPKTPKDAQIAQGIAMVYGPGGLAYQLGAIDSTTEIMGMCLTDANLSKLIASAKAGSDDLGKMTNVAQTTKALPEKPVLEMYFAVDETGRTALSYMKQLMGAGPNIQLPENLPPVGFAATANGTTMRGETHIPTDLVAAMVAAYFQAMMGGGGGNGGL